MPLHPLGVAPVEIVLGEGGGDPIPPGLEGLHAEKLPRYLVLQLGKQEENAGGQVRTVGGVGPSSRSSAWCVVPVEDKTSLLFQRPLQKHVEGTDDVYGVNSGPPGYHTDEDDALPSSCRGSQAPSACPFWPESCTLWAQGTPF